MNTLNGLTVKILTRAAQIFAWPIVICGVGPSGSPVLLNVDGNGNAIINPGGAISAAPAKAGTLTITTGGTSQPLFAAAARSLVIVQNPSTATESFFIAFGANATTDNNSLEIQPGQTQVIQALASQAINVNAVTTNHAFFAIGV